MNAASWDARYTATPLLWSAGPNRLFAELTMGLHPGHALDVACGEGRNAIWLAQQGWRVTAVDFSAVAVDRARQRARALGVEVDWRVADITRVDLGVQAYDLVAVLYLHLPPPDQRDALTRACTAVRPGGTLLVLGHDRDNLTRGTGGPQDPDLLYTTDDLASAAVGLDIARLTQVGRPVEDAVAIDTLLLAIRPAVTPAGQP